MKITVKKNTNLSATIYIEEVSGASLYTIYYSTDPAEGYTQLGTTATCSYTTDILTDGYIYYFRASSTTSGVKSQPSSSKHIYISNAAEGLYEVCTLIKGELVSEYNTKKIVISKEQPQEILKDYIIWIQPTAESEEILSNYTRELSYSSSIYILSSVIGKSEEKAINLLFTYSENIKTMLRDNILGGYVNSAEVTDTTPPMSVDGYAGNVAVMGMRLDTLFKRRLRMLNAPFSEPIYGECTYG